MHCTWVWVARPCVRVLTSRQLATVISSCAPKSPCGCDDAGNDATAHRHPFGRPVRSCTTMTARHAPEPSRGMTVGGLSAAGPSLPCFAVLLSVSPSLSVSRVRLALGFSRPADLCRRTRSAVRGCVVQTACSAGTVACAVCPRRKSSGASWGRRAQALPSRSGLRAVESSFPKPVGARKINRPGGNQPADRIRTG